MSFIRLDEAVGSRFIALVDNIDGPCLRILEHEEIVPQQFHLRQASSGSMGFIAIFFSL